MRELVKSTFGFTLAMSMFGLEQMRNVLRRPEDKETKRADNIQHDLDSISESAEQQFSEQSQRLFDAGNKFQRAMIDMAFDLFNGEKGNKTRITDLAADVAESSAEALRKIGERSETTTDAVTEPKG